MATAARVLLVEDDDLLRESVAAALRGAGLVVHAAADGSGVEATAEAFRPDVALLDVSLPGADGFALARRLRHHRDLPVLFVTARDAVVDRLAGFSAGADDYVVKPFSTEELLARLRAVLRRTGTIPTTTDLGGLVIDEGAGVVVTAGGQVLDLTATEFRLLSFLGRHRGRTLSKTQILTQVWGYEAYDPNLVEVHVSALRRKIEAHSPRLVHTVRGVGYVLRPVDRA